MTVVVGLFTALQSTSEKDALPSSMLGMLVNSDPVTKSVLALLLVLSLISWAIMFSKWRGFKMAETNGRAFMADFERARGMDDAMLCAQRAKPSAFTAVFARAVSFLHDTKPALGATNDRTARLSGSQVEALRLVLDAEGSKARDSGDCWPGRIST